MSKQSIMQKNIKKYVMNETSLIRELDHPNIIKQIQTSEDNKFI